jgi:nucleotide-binding universal stress UspA family protein
LQSEPNPIVTIFIKSTDSDSNYRRSMKEPKAWLSKRLQNILVATDFHQNSRLAFSYAAALARQLDSKLTALNAFEFGPYSQRVEVLDHLPSMERREAEELLKEFVQQAGHPETHSEVVVVEGFVTTAIIKALSQKEIDLLVIGTEGVHQGLDHLLLGSNTEALMLGSERPTLTVGPRVPEKKEAQLDLRNVVYVSDFSVASTAAARYAFAFSQAFDVPSEIYQLASKALLNDVPRLKRAAAEYCDMLLFVDPDLPAQWFDPEFQLSRIVPEADLIARIAEPSNLLVLGVQPASFMQRHLQTSLAYRVLANAASPVLTIPAEGTVRS